MHIKSNRLPDVVFLSGSRCSRCIQMIWGWSFSPFFLHFSSSRLTSNHNYNNLCCAIHFSHETTCISTFLFLCLDIWIFLHFCGNCQETYLNSLSALFIWDMCSLFTLCSSLFSRLSKKQHCYFAVLDNIQVVMLVVFCNMKFNFLICMKSCNTLKCERVIYCIIIYYIKTNLWGTKHLVGGYIVRGTNHPDSCTQY